MKAAKYQIPEHLAPETAAWVKRTLKAYTGFEEHHFKLLIIAAESWDRAEQARVLLAQLGLTFIDGNDCPRPRPEVKIEHDSMIRFARALRELSLDTDAPDSSRPPRIAGRY